MSDGTSSQSFEVRLQAGDEAVLEEILREHGPPIAALLRKRYSHQLTEQDLEDILAAALFRVWQYRDQFDAGRSGLRTWFFRISENLFRDMLRLGWHKSRRLETPVEPADFSRSSSSVEANSADPVLRIPRELLHALIEQLPDSQRRILLADASTRDGVAPSRELAAELGIPPASVRVYRRRALDRLRRAIEQSERDCPTAVPQ